MPTPTFLASDINLDSAVVSVPAGGVNVIAIVGVVRDFNANVEPTMNGSSATRTSLGVAPSGFGQLGFYAFSDVPSGTVTFAATGRVVGVMVYSNASIKGGTVLENSSGWTTPAPLINPDDVCLVFGSAAWTSDVSSPQYISTSTGSVTLTKVQEGLSFYSAYDWGLGMYTITAASPVTSYSYVPSFSSAPSINRTSRLVLTYVNPAGPSLTRTTLGKLFAYSDTPLAGILSPFSVSDWAANGNGTSITVVSGRLRLTFSGTNYRARLTAAAVGHTDIWLRARVITFTGFPAGSIVARGSAQSGTTNLSGVSAIPAGFGTTNNAGIYERNAVANAPLLQSSLVSAASAAGLSMDLLAIGTTALYRQSSAGYSERTLSNLTVVSGSVFLGESGANGTTINYSLASGELSNLVSVQGLTPGMVVDVLGATDNVLGSGTADITGVATIDLRAANVSAGAARAVRVKSGLVTIETATPYTGVWGGDVWQFSAPSPSGSPARAVRRKFGARSLLLNR